MAEPAFVPKPGQVDYTKIRYAPVVNIVVAHGGKLLLVRRSQHMRLYPGLWNGVSGFLDDDRDIEDKVHEELSEELGVTNDQITSIELGQLLLQDAPEYRKTWLVVPVLVRVNSRSVTLDWEAEKAEWYTPQAAQKLELMPGFPGVLDVVTKML